MKKTKLLVSSLLLLLVSCNGINISSNESSSSFDTSSSDTSIEENTLLQNFLNEASISYSIKAVVDEYTNYNSLQTTAKNYLDVAGKEDYFSIVKYNQVFDNMGTINRNVIDSDTRYKSYDYEGSQVVSSSYLNLSNEICYTIHKDNYGYTTAWDSSFKSFFTNLTVNDFKTEDEITYTLNIDGVSDDVCNEILYQLGCLAVSSVTSFHVESVNLIVENNAFSKINFTFIDDEEENLYTQYYIEGDIIVGSEAEKDVKVEEQVNGENIEELDNAFKSLTSYNFDFSLSVTISRNVIDEYTTNASSDGQKIVSSKFAYVESTSGLDYYLSLLNDDNLYKTMSTIEDAHLSDVLPSFDVSSYFFTKASKNTYILSNKAKRCSPSLNEVSAYQPFSLSFTKLTIKLEDNSIIIQGVNGSYQIDIAYTNINKISSIEFRNDNYLGYGDYLENYEWSYEDYIEIFRTQLDLEDTAQTYEVLNNIPTFYSNLIELSPYFAGIQLEEDNVLGIKYEYSNTTKRDYDFGRIISIYTSNGFNKNLVSIKNGYAFLTKEITINDTQKTLSLYVLTGKSYEIPIIGVFPLIVE